MIGLGVRGLLPSLMLRLMARKARGFSNVGRNPKGQGRVGRSRGGGDGHAHGLFVLGEVFEHRRVVGKIISQGFQSEEGLGALARFFQIDPPRNSPRSPAFTIWVL
jgi:hypothetical protein